MSAAEATPAAASGMRGRKLILRIVMRVVMPSLMIGFGAYIVASRGVEGLVALLPILAAHVVGFLVIYPAYLRFRRRQETSPTPTVDS
jgi:membrane protein YdbS with pleckstrin-like domain